MIICGMNMKNGRVKKMLMNTYHYHGTLMRIYRKNSGKNCLVMAEMNTKIILKVFRYLVLVENKIQNKILYGFLRQN